jgi:hypothetical protein
VKRVLAFLLLVGFGIGALWYAVSDEPRPNDTAPTQSSGQSPPATGGLPMQQGKLGGAQVSHTGSLEIPQYRTVPLPDGTSRHEQVSLMKAAKSQPVGEGLQQLDGVEVLLFEKNAPAARITARQAFVELSKDASGRASLKEQKEIDLRDAVFESLPGASLQGVRFEIGDAKVQVGDNELQVRTASDDQPVLLTVDGERRGTLRGRGMQARLPRDNQSALRRADFEILREPVLESQGMSVRAEGRMRYVEDLATVLALVPVDDPVQVDLDRGELSAPRAADGSAPRSGGAASPRAGGAGRIFGDQFIGWMQRAPKKRADEQREDVAWHRLLLTGSPARIEMPEGKLTTPRISVLPGLFGDPFLVTAYGGQSHIEQEQLGPKGAERITGTSPRRIHLVRPGASTGAVYRAFGFPQWTLPSFNGTQIVIFEGASRITDGARTVEASEGMHLIRRELTNTGVARGFGDVRVHQAAELPQRDDLIATGNDGFRLVVTEDSQDLQLGPAPGDAAWRDHRYEVAYGPAKLHGIGACRVERADESTRLRLDAPGPDIGGVVMPHGVEFENVTHLEAELAGRDVRSLTAEGLPARARRAGLRDSVRGAAPRIVQIGPDSLRLLAAEKGHPIAGLAAADELPVLARTLAVGEGRGEGGVQVRGPLIDVHHVGSGDVLVDARATGAVRPVVDARVANADGTVTTAKFDAERLQALPWALPREVRRAYSAGASGAVADLVFPATSQPWLLVDDVRGFRLVDPRHGIVQGRGRRLVLSQGMQAGMFVGDPDRLEPAEVARSHEGRDMTTRGARIRVLREDDVRVQALRTFGDRPTFLLPSVVLHEPGSDDLLAHMTATCQGNIDVLPDAVVFDGPVAANGLRPDGSEDPDGIHLNAGRLRMARDLETGDIVRVLGDDVQLDWSRVDATSAEIELDLLRSLCIARDPHNATVTADGRVWTAPHVEVNYETLAVTCYNGRLVQTRPASAGKQ